MLEGIGEGRGISSASLGVRKDYHDIDTDLDIKEANAALQVCVAETKLSRIVLQSGPQPELDIW